MTLPTSQALPGDLLTQWQHAWLLAFNAWTVPWWTLQQQQWDHWASWMSGGVPLDI